MFLLSVNPQAHIVYKCCADSSILTEVGHCVAAGQKYYFPPLLVLFIACFWEYTLRTLISNVGVC